jgi:hypothetical protein
MTVEDEIRESVAAGDFERASREFDAYVRRLRVAVEQGRCTAAEMCRMAELAGWSCRMALAARAHLRDQLRDIRNRAWVSGVYRGG